jgi:hypothetical protein
MRTTDPGDAELRLPAGKQVWTFPTRLRRVISIATPITSGRSVGMLPTVPMREAKQRAQQSRGRGVSFDRLVGFRWWPRAFSGLVLSRGPFQIGAFAIDERHGGAVVRGTQSRKEDARAPIGNASAWPRVDRTYQPHRGIALRSRRMRSRRTREWGRESPLAERRCTGLLGALASCPT